MFIQIARPSETVLNTLTAAEYMAQHNAEMEEALAAQPDADGYLYPDYWIEGSLWEGMTALQFLCATAYEYFSDSYKEENGVRPRWVDVPSTLEELEALEARF